jgi:hypothetical protein
MNIFYVNLVVIEFCPSHSKSVEGTRKRRIQTNYSHILASSTLREQSSIKIVIKDDNGIETRIKEMCGPS